jgi:hypothetical protein
MPADDAERVHVALRRALGRRGREHRFGVVVVDGEASKIWRTYEIPPYTVIFAFLTAQDRRERGLATSGHVVAAIPDQNRLDDVMRRLYEEAHPDDWGWD